MPKIIGFLYPNYAKKNSSLSKCFDSKTTSGFEEEAKIDEEVQEEASNC